MSLCDSCGGSYDDKFKFCPYCGKAKIEPIDININVNVSSSDEWEYCEIEVYSMEKETPLNFFRDRKLIFCAIAISPNGRYTADKSEPLSSLSGGFLKKSDYEIGNNNEIIFNEGAHVKFNDFVNQLVKNGWQPLGKGMKWYSEKFRRKVKK